MTTTILKEIAKLKKRLQNKADEFWKMDADKQWVSINWNTFHVWIASGIEEAIWHIEKFEEKIRSKVT